MLNLKQPAANAPASQHERKGNTHILLLAIRQALIIALGAIEDYAGMEHSIVPRRKR